MAEADSAGVALCKGEKEGRLVVFRGGWADLEYWSGRPCDEPVTEAPGWDDRMGPCHIHLIRTRIRYLYWYRLSETEGLQVGEICARPRKPERASQARLNFPNMLHYFCGIRSLKDHNAPPLAATRINCQA